MFSILVEVYLELKYILEVINGRFQEKVNQSLFLFVLIRGGFSCYYYYCFGSWLLKEFEVYFILVIYVQKLCQNFVAIFRAMSLQPRCWATFKDNFTEYGTLG